MVDEMRKKAEIKRNIQSKYPFRKRELYNKADVRLRPEELKDYFIDTIEICGKESAIENVENIKIGTEKCVWVLYSDNEILQVGEVESHRLLQELESDIEDMYADNEFSIESIDDECTLVALDTAFYLNTYYVKEGKDISKNRNKYMYKKIREENLKLSISIIDIDAYLHIKEMTNELEKQMIEMTKSYFAESQIAYYSQAKYWNVFYSGVGYKALELFRNQNEEQKMKTGRPVSEDPRAYKISARLTAAELEEFETYARSQGMTNAEVIKRGIRMQMEAGTLDKLQKND